jgi:hypothetical protein
MTDYTKNANFTAKTGTTVEGADFDAEFDEIATAIASKEDKASKGANNGYCGLGAGGLVDPSDLPAASASAQGAVELATNAEAIAGIDTARAVTPANLAAVVGAATTLAIKPSSTSRTSTTTIADDPDLVVAIGSTGLWEVDALVMFDSTTVGLDLKLSLLFSGSVTADNTNALIIREATSSSDLSVFSIPISSSYADWAVCDIPGAPMMARIHALLRVTAAGNVVIGWAQNSSSGTAVLVLGDSFVRARRLGA